MEELNNNTLRNRLEAYRQKYPVSFIKIGLDMGLNPTNARYLLSRFMRGIIDLNDGMQTLLDDYLTGQGF